MIRGNYCNFPLGANDVDSSPSPKMISEQELMKVAMLISDCNAHAARFKVGSCLDWSMREEVSQSLEAVAKSPSDCFFVVLSNLEIMFAECEDVGLVLLIVHNGVAHTVV